MPTLLLHRGTLGGRALGSAGVRGAAFILHLGAFHDGQGRHGALSGAGGDS